MKLSLMTGRVLPAALKETIANFRGVKPDRRQRGERRSGRNIDQHIKSVAKAMEVTKDPAAREVFQMKLGHLRERLRRFVPRKKTDRRSAR